METALSAVFYLINSREWKERETDRDRVKERETERKKGSTRRKKRQREKVYG